MPGLHPMAGAGGCFALSTSRVKLTATPVTPSNPMKGPRSRRTCTGAKQTSQATACLRAIASDLHRRIQRTDSEIHVLVEEQRWENQIHHHVNHYHQYLQTRHLN